MYVASVQHCQSAMGTAREKFVNFIYFLYFCRPKVFCPSWGDLLHALYILFNYILVKLSFIHFYTHLKNEDIAQVYDFPRAKLSYNMLD
jgi:hypothetical protein